MIGDMRKFVFDVAYAIGSQVLSRAALTLLLILVARYFGQKEFAAFALFNFSVTAAASFVTLGVHLMASKLAATSLVHRSKISGLFASLLMLLPTSILTGGLLLSPAGVWLTGDSQSSAALVWIAAVSTGLLAWSNNVLASLHRQAASFWAAVAGVLALAVLFGLGYTTNNIAKLYAGYVLSQLVPALLQIWFCWQATSATMQELKPRKGDFAEAIFGSFWFSLMTIASSLVPLVLTKMLLLYGGGDKEVATLAIGWQLLGLASLIPARLTLVLYPYQIKQVSSGLSRQLLTIIATMIISLLGVASVAALFATPILSLWHMTSEHAAIIVFTFIATAGFAAAANMLGNQLVLAQGLVLVCCISLVVQFMILVFGWQLMRFGLWWHLGSSMAFAAAINSLVTAISHAWFTKSQWFRAT